MTRAAAATTLVTALACGAFACEVFKPAEAAAVTIRLANAEAVPIEDAVVMFDPADATPTATAQTAAVDQINRRFVPHVTVVQKGTSISFPNSDRIRHQVYSFSPAKTFTLKLYAGSPRMSVTFDKPGLVVLGCNIHDSMVGFIAVADSPYFGKSGSNGIVTLDLPPGAYRLRVWHAELAAPIAPRLVTIGAGAQTIPVLAAVDHGVTAPAPWP